MKVILALSLAVTSFTATCCAQTAKVTIYDSFGNFTQGTLDHRVVSTCHN